MKPTEEDYHFQLLDQICSKQSIYQDLNMLLTEYQINYV